MLCTILYKDMHWRFLLARTCLGGDNFPLSLIVSAGTNHNSSNLPFLVTETNASGTAESGGPKSDSSLLES